MIYVKKNAIMLCGIAKPWLETLKLLNEQMGISPVYYIAWESDLNKETLKECFPNCFYQTVEDAWRGKGFPNIRKAPIDEELLRSISFEHLVFLQMLDRLDMNNHFFSFRHRQYFFYDLLSLWLQIIDDYDIKLVISPSIPHRNFDYALYVASKIKNVEFIMFQMTPFGDSTLIVDDVNSTPGYLKSGINEKYENCNLAEHIEKQILLTKQAYSEAEPHYMRNQKKSGENFRRVMNIWLNMSIKYINISNLFKKSRSYYVEYDSMPNNGYICNGRLEFLKIQNRKRLRELKRYYESNCIDLNDIGEKYVLIALHYQPEETSCPTGGAYCNQLLIIQLLDNYMDKNIKLVVKEHKSQFHPLKEGAQGRDKNFYDKLLNISPRVITVSVDSDPFELVDGALATVTVSGTIGWQSVIRGTPALIFGRAWYEDMPYVYKIKTVKDLDLAWNMTVKNDYKTVFDDVLIYHHRLQDYLISAKHYKSYEKRSNRSDTESSINLTNGIKNHLINKSWQF